MSVETFLGSDVSVTHLVTGIVADAQNLGLKHLALFRSEVLRDLRQTREGLVSVAIGFALIQIGGLLVCHMFALLLSQLVPTLPLWGSYAIVGVVVIGCGSIPLMNGIRRLNTLDPISDGSAQIMKETAK